MIAFTIFLSTIVVFYSIVWFAKYRNKKENNNKEFCDVNYKVIPPNKRDAPCQRTIPLSCPEGEMMDVCIDNGPCCLKAYDPLDSIRRKKKRRIRQLYLQRQRRKQHGMRIL